MFFLVHGKLKKKRGSQHEKNIVYAVSVHTIRTSSGS